MPTMLEHTTITHVPRVQRLLDEGSRIWPGKPTHEILVTLAERGLASTPPRKGDNLMLFPGPQSGLTVADVDNALLDD